jgi:uncharacterized membrane protein SpoIIM required for sporulation
MARWRFLAHEGLAWSRRLSHKSDLNSVENIAAAYRRSATELARVKAFSPDRELADYIETAVANTHFAVHRRRRPKLADVLAGALFGFPALVRRYWAYFAVSAAITFGTAAIAFAAVWFVPESYHLFVDRDLSAGRDPVSSTESLRATLGGVATSADEDAWFASLLFTHNTRIAFICFAFGILLGLPTIYVLIVNGLMLGAFASLFVQRGLGVEFFAWILPHGVPEIGAIVLCGGAGLMLGHRLLNPGAKARSTALRETAIDASIVAVGCVPLLAMAGLIEGVFRQTYASTELRYAVFALVTLVLMTWLLLAGRQRLKPVPQPA